MIYNLLGTTGLKVSKICFGSLTLGPLQKNVTPEEGGKIIAYAMEHGVNFIDTANLYHNYPHIKNAAKYCERELIISTKSYDYNEIGAKMSLTKAQKELNRDVIDIFMLHEQESIHTIRGHWEAINFLIKEKKKGNIRALGISTHRIEGVYGACEIDDLEVIHPIINYKGLGIEDGSLEDMEKAIACAKSKGKGIYGMKIFGGGNLINNVDECFNYINNLNILDSIAIGMQTKSEVDYNINKVLGRKIDVNLANEVKNKKRRLLIDSWCNGCGSCQIKCHQNAIKLIDNKAIVEEEKCITCGYCGAYCPQFCIKVV
ncbi:aldo/keto reductase [Alkalibaculum sp. M08DMB]|uniref:Aldo/keto reductase n=1 Tax=Alkalibaculum sporogenes TaxID=2655001 RepID=A0A6A7KA46_9FIRM|nr:aldo/keto reductase [Alkalibaculum sporogenes]MPW26304.1 aldo/keto reductase [Alkalibaculum sporogenes]